MIDNQDIGNTEIIEFGHKMKEEMKAMQSEIKKNIQRINK